eukprot:CAMPEP_0176458872 /NCGR_PEP_ID=MMETSP0127-20121128/32883_1 /TAXON_ID=938130 /ORGANISM="Platyophrya macrostoma, Strain WH" /LENGTH=97 /DNA_ID=CAMNT_0017849587 /DNA_START=32 /DNA_END=325 /DNA_ORIENTATION=-
MTKLTVELSGGLELLFDKQKTIALELEGEKVKNIHDLIFYMKDNLLKEKPELFITGDSLRPGILVLINDTDWELEGKHEYLIQEKDNICFISTLHGG